MLIGRMNRRVVLQLQGLGRDEIGQPNDSWVDVVSIWADIRHQSGLEAVKADASVSMTKASIRIRYRSGVQAGMRVMHAGVVYSIVAVLPDVSGREYIDLVCEVVNVQS